MRGPLVYKLHLLIVLSYEPLNKCLSQIEIATAKTGPSCPTNSYSSRSSRTSFTPSNLFSAFPFVYFFSLTSSGFGTLFIFWSIYIFIMSSTTIISWFFFDIMKTWTMLVAIPTAMTAPLSDIVAQFTSL